MKQTDGQTDGRAGRVMRPIGRSHNNTARAQTASSQVTTLFDDRVFQIATASVLQQVSETILPSFALFCSMEIFRLRCFDRSLGTSLLAY